MNHPETLDHIYRYQRHLYDATRRLFLFGRERLLNSMAISGEERVLEMGCGTGRNLIRLAERHPESKLYGVDASRRMLATAKARIAAHGLTPRIALTAGLAEELNPETMFGASLGFNRIFFSYSLSMMPQWQEALAAAFDHLAPEGTLHVVDFWDQGDWPTPLARLFIRWLALFHVRFDEAMIPALSRHFASRGQSICLMSIGGRYAFLALPAPAPTK